MFFDLFEKRSSNGVESVHVYVCSTKPMTKKQYIRKILNDPKLLEDLKSAMDPELLQEHKETLKFKNAIWGLKRLRDLWKSNDPTEKRCAFPGLEGCKLEVANYLEIRSEDLRPIGNRNLTEYTWYLEDEIVDKFTKDII